MNHKNESKTDKLTMQKVLGLFVIISLFTLFFVGGPSNYSSPILKEFWNIGHTLFFALTTYKIIELIRLKPTWIIVFSSLFYCLTLGTSIEILQSKIGRNLDIHDIYRNALGAFLALSIYSYQKKRAHHGKYIACSYLIIVTLLILIEQKKLFQTIKIDIQARYNFPSLARFEKTNELKQWSGSNLSLSTENVLTGLYSLKIELDSKKKYSEVTLIHMPRNWEGYEYLLINIYNPNEDALKITAKITDYIHDMSEQSHNNRYNKGFTLLEGQWSIIKIPLEDVKNSPKTRELQLDNISRLSLFSTDLTKDQIIYIDSVTLN